MQDRERRTQLEQQTLQALRERRFKEASEMVSAFEAQQVFPRGVGVDWKHCNSARDVEMLKVMFNSRPKILGSLTDEQMAHLRVAAGMMYLWGTSQAENWLPDNFETELVMDNDAAARMISFHASHQFDIAQYHASGIKKVEVLATDNSCAACKKMAKRKYKLDEVPELPYEKCTSEMGCRCTIVVADF